MCNLVEKHFRIYFRSIAPVRSQGGPLVQYKQEHLDTIVSYKF
jgi:hypothetical protein